jgi:glycosyltransferase involved in cell wall biosynthesis
VATPAVSVVIPTRNRVDLLREAVESVVRQSWTDWELIVADDGSTDGTAAYLRSISDPRISSLRLDRGGSASSARTAGVGRARAEWIAFLDSDDLWLERKLAVQLAHLRDAADCSWSYTDAELIGPYRTVLPMHGTHETPSGWILPEMLRFEAAVSIQTLMVRRSLLQRVGGFDLSFRSREDYDFSLRLAAASPACGVPERLTLIRDHPERTTRQRRLIELLEWNERLFRKAEGYVPTPELRALCRRQRAVQYAQRARLLWREGRRGGAVSAAVAAIRLDLSSGWRSAARMLRRRKRS